MATRIDWDKARRYKNARKPDYRDAFLDGRSPVSFTLPAPVLGRTMLKSSARPAARFSYTQPNTAREIRTCLKSLGVKGNKLTDLTNDILRGKMQMANVEFEIRASSLIEKGFDPMPPEISGNTAVLRLIRFSQTGEALQRSQDSKIKNRSQSVPAS